MNLNKLTLNKHTKIILSGLVIGSMLIGGLGYYVVNDIQNKMDKSYADFAQLMTKAIASQTSDLENLEDSQKSEILAKRLLPFFDKNEDVSYVEYKDRKNNIIYSSKADFPGQSTEVTLNVSSPIIVDNKIVGAVTVGMTNKGPKMFSQSTKKSLLSVFSITWLAFAFFLFLNFGLMSKEL